MVLALVAAPCCQQGKCLLSLQATVRSRVGYHQHRCVYAEHDSCDQATLTQKTILLHESLPRSRLMDVDALRRVCWSTTCDNHQASATWRFDALLVKTACDNTFINSVMNSVFQGTYKAGRQGVVVGSFSVENTVGF